MAWTSPRTWVAGAVATAAQMNAHVRDNLQALLPLDAVAWTSYTPTFTQSATITKTVAYAKWTQIGKMVTVQVSLAATSAGTANNAVTVGLPTAAAYGNFQAAGAGYISDTSVPTNIPGIVYLASTTTVKFADATAAANFSLGQTGAAFAAAIASGDTVTFTAVYEAA